ncbi:pentapeptide repeat-containing protein [Argonema galeatum]|uniref:pentapeptide repeat-containing protein n=1 Tax=Argonema galeatum TaxID=2942762 RepID=UPI0020137E4D|nr:pentapeptide repeat-containing protein [Argonema galeatum]MCL1463807.1 pentapeptide repeat-containing protein [Argonema galeatum A003/A1]
MKTKILATVSFLTTLWLASPLLAQNVSPIERLLTTKECQGCDLSGANLNSVDLSGADLSGADLSDASLKNTLLVGANLSGANLRGADLTQAMLTGANISGADLTYANLTDANLFRAKAKESGGADFTNAIFNGTTMPNGTVRDRQALPGVPENVTPEQLPATIR